MIFLLLGEHMIKRYRLEEVADVFTGIRITRYQNGDLKEQDVLKKTYEDSPNIEKNKELLHYFLQLQGHLDNLH